MDINLKDMVQGVKFHIRKQETFSVEDIYDIEEQLKNKISSEVGRKVEDFIKTQNGEIEKQRLANAGFKEEFEVLKTAKADVEKQLAELQTSQKDSEKVIASYKEKEFKTEAVELLGGLVATNAEVDVMRQLGNAIQEIEFDEDEKIESRREKVKPLIEGLIKTKSYLAPSTKEGSDNVSLIKNTRTQKQESTEDEYTPPSGRFSRE